MVMLKIFVFWLIVLSALALDTYYGVFQQSYQLSVDQYACLKESNQTYSVIIAYS